MSAADRMATDRLQMAQTLCDRIADDYQAMILSLTERISRGEQMGPIGVGRLLDLSRRAEALARASQTIQEVADAIANARPEPISRAYLQVVHTPEPPPDAS